MAEVQEVVEYVPSTSLEDAMAKVGLDKKTFSSDIYNQTGTRPKDIASHVLADAWFMIGMTPTQFLDLHGGATLDFDKLKNDFKQFCPDYEEPLDQDRKMFAIEFCARMLFDVGPQSRTKDKKSDHCWTFWFPKEYTVTLKEPVVVNGVPVIEGGVVQTKDVVHEQYSYRPVFVCTFRTKSPPAQFKTNENQLCLTIKQAALLSMVTYDQLIVFAINQVSIKLLLTPLAGAIYTARNCSDLSQILGIELGKIHRIVNASCQSAGQYLPNSDIDCAVAACVAATTNMADQKQRIQLIQKTAKQYLQAGKVHSGLNLIIYMYFATGGLPDDLKPKRLIQTYDAIQQSRGKEKTEVSGTDDVKTTLTNFMNYRAKIGSEEPNDIVKHINFDDSIKLEAIAVAALAAHGHIKKKKKKINDLKKSQKDAQEKGKGKGKEKKKEKGIENEDMEEEEDDKEDEDDEDDSDVESLDDVLVRMSDQFLSKKTKKDAQEHTKEKMSPAEQAEAALKLNTAAPNLSVTTSELSIDSDYEDDSPRIRPRMTPKGKTLYNSEKSFLQFLKDVDPDLFTDSKQQKTLRSVLYDAERCESVRAQIAEVLRDTWAMLDDTIQTGLYLTLEKDAPNVFAALNNSMTED